MPQPGPKPRVRRKIRRRPTVEKSIRVVYASEKEPTVEKNIVVRYDTSLDGTCYLCGAEILEGEGTRDHVPAQQFFAPVLRQVNNLDKLTTLPAHRRCNEAYGKDEQYVVHTFAPIAMGSTGADALVRQHAEDFKAGRSLGLGRKILHSFEDRPSGLYLPNGRVVMRVDGDRIARVIWKVIRGLYMQEYGGLLPETTPHFVDWREPENKAPFKAQEVWNAVNSQEAKGPYQGVFAYRHLRMEAEEKGIVLYGWGMLWWDRIVVFGTHHGPSHVREAVAASA